MTRHVHSMYILYVILYFTSLRVFAKTNWNFKCYNYIYFERDDVKCVCEHVLVLFTITTYYYILELRTTRAIGMLLFMANKNKSSN